VFNLERNPDTWLDNEKRRIASQGSGPKDPDILKVLGFFARLLYWGGTVHAAAFFTAIVPVLIWLGCLWWSSSVAGGILLFVAAAGALIYGIRQIACPVTYWVVGAGYLFVLIYAVLGKVETLTLSLSIVIGFVVLAIIEAISKVRAQTNE
jgi:hypothetical protein